MVCLASDTQNTISLQIQRVFTFCFRYPKHHFPSNSEAFYLLSSNNQFFELCFLYVFSLSLLFLVLFFLFIFLLFFLVFFIIFFFPLFFLHLLSFPCPAPIPFEIIIILGYWPILFSFFGIVFLMFALFASGFACCCCWNSKFVFFVIVDLCFF